MRPTARDRHPFPVLLLIAALATACSGYDPDPVDLTGSRAVSFDVDGARVEGRLFGEVPAGDGVGVVLVHGLTVDQRSWYAFAQELVGEGYTALTFDFRGYCPGGDGGCSEGDRDVGTAWRDVQEAVAFLREEGAEQIVLAGSSMGGTASLVAAAAPDTGSLSAVIALSAPVTIEDLSVTPDALGSLPVKKLFLAGVGDGPAAADAQRLYDIAAPPKRVEVLAADDHGAALLSGNRGREASTLILTTIETATDEESAV